MAVYENVTIIYGSESGNTERVAEILASTLQKKGVKTLVKSVLDNDVDTALKNAKAVLLGSSTWDHGKPQEDFKAWMNAVDSSLLKGKEVGVFATGDQEGWPEAFCGAADVISTWTTQNGAVKVGDSLKVGGDADEFREMIEAFALRFIGEAAFEDPERVML